MIRYKTVALAGSWTQRFLKATACDAHAFAAERSFGSGGLDSEEFGRCGTIVKRCIR
jgi:hypothetical protein